MFPSGMLKDSILQGGSGKETNRAYTVRVNCPLTSSPL